MQDLLPFGVDSNLRQLLKVADSVIGPNTYAPAGIQLSGPHSVLIAGTASNIAAPDGVVIVAAGGRITGKVHAKILIVLGRIEPDSDTKARLVCENIITGKDSVIIDADILYASMVTHQNAMMRRVNLDQMELSVCVPPT